MHRRLPDVLSKSDQQLGEIDIMAQPKQPKVCQRVRRGKITFFCELGGKQYGLGTDPIAAQVAFGQLLTEHHARKQLGVDQQASPQPAKVEKPLTVRAVLLAFLESVKNDPDTAESTYRFYARAIVGDAKTKPKGNRKPFVSFDAYLVKQGLADMLVADFGPSVVNDWIASHFSEAKANYRHNLIRPIQAAFNWAKVNRRDWRKHLADDPLAGLKKPKQTPRDAYITAEQWAKVLETAEGEFLDLLIVLKESGARPQELRLAEAKHFDREGRRLYFPKPIKKVRGEQRERIIRLEGRAFEIVQRLALKYPNGPLFRNERRNAWTKNALNWRCKRLRDKLGFALCPYSLRHTFCQDAINRGVHPVMLAELIGHANALMVMKVYQKASKCEGDLQAALKRAIG